MYVTHFSIQGSKPFAGWKIAEILRLFDDMQQQPGGQQATIAAALSGGKPKKPLGRSKGKSKAARTMIGRRKPTKAVDWRNPW